MLLKLRRVYTRSEHGAGKDFDGRPPKKKPRRGKCRGQAEEYCCPHVGSVRSETTPSTISAAIPPNEGGLASVSDVRPMYRY